jgi:hypothetical protein
MDRFTLDGLAQKAAAASGYAGGRQQSGNGYNNGGGNGTGNGAGYDQAAAAYALARL